MEVYSVLSPDGVPTGREPDVPAEVLRRIYRFMSLSRFFDGRAVALQRQGRLGTYGPNAGQEAVSAASAAALGPEDWVVPTYREMAAILLRGVPLQTLLCRWKGLPHTWPGVETGVLPINFVIGALVPHAVGMAMAARIRGERRAVLCFFGDGASSKGDFHEAANFAGVFKAPVILICQNNQWAISVPRSRQTAAPTIASRAVGYGMPGRVVDGQDALAVYLATQEARERALAGEGPTLIEAITYRFGAHTTADDPRRYRTPEEMEAVRQKDPIPRLRRYLEARGLWSEAEEAAMQAEFERDFQQALAEVEAAPVDPEWMFTAPYASPPATVEDERRRLFGKVPSA